MMYETFKQARSAARLLAQERGYWAYIRKVKNHKQILYDVNVESGDYYVAKDGRVCKVECYQREHNRRIKHGVHGMYPFAPKLRNRRKDETLQEYRKKMNLGDC